MTMKKKQRITKRKKELLDKPKRDIADLIDDMAYLDESQNIKKSKSFLDNIYQLNQ